MTEAGATQGPNPFVAYREKLDSYVQAVENGWSDAAYIDTVETLNEEIAAVAGVGFAVTPFVTLEIDPSLSSRSIVAKVETGNVGGSHKARHLFGLLLQERFGEPPGAIVEPSDLPPLGIASCGNAAVGAAVLARATNRHLRVFVPTVADSYVLDELHRLSADVVVCHRRDGVVGDPCVQMLHADLEQGTQPFTVQGTTCPGVFDGARTLGLELADQFADAGVSPAHLYLQVGGGAFAASVVDGLVRSGIDVLPRLHPVQPQRAHPLVAAWERLLPRLLAIAEEEQVPLPDIERGKALADALQPLAMDGLFDEVLAEAGDVMQPWPTEPTSVASGILDDVTYDWRPVMGHQLRTGGWPLLPTEDDFRLATEVAATQVEPPPDATGAAGLAGALIDSDAPQPAAVVLSGVDRSQL